MMSHLKPVHIKYICSIETNLLVTCTELEFWFEIINKSYISIWQMTINSLAVCLGPSLFNVASQAGPLQKILPWPSSPSNLANSKEINDSVVSL